jgi:hypothetical protein
MHGSSEKHKKFRDLLLLNLSLQLGAYVWNNETGAVQGADRFIRYGFVGSSDIIGLLPTGQFLGVEVKTGNARQSDKQKAFEAAIHKRKGAYYVAKWTDGEAKEAVDKTINEIRARHLS